MRTIRRTGCARNQLVFSTSLLLCCLSTTISRSADGICQEPDNTQNDACAIDYGYISSGAEISTDTDIDFYKFEGSRGDIVQVVTTNAAGSELDGAIHILDASGACLAANDDISNSDTFRSRVTVVLDEEATYWIRYADFQNAPGQNCTFALTGPDPVSKDDGTRGTQETSAASLPSTTGRYELTLSRVEPPRVTALQAGSGFNGIVPLQWNGPVGDSGFWILGDQSLEQVIERSEDGETFVEVGTTVFSAHIDDPISNDARVHYRIRLDYPYGIGTNWSDSEAATPRESGHRESIPVTASPPTLDGSIADGEWSAARQIPLTEELTGTVNGTLYVMYDDEYLYLAAAREGRRGQLGIYFDSNNDDSWGTTGREGNYWIFEDGAVAFRPITGNYPTPSFLDAIPSPTGVEAAATPSGSQLQYEVRIDLATAHLQANPGDEIGLYVFAFDFLEGAFSNFPAGAIFFAPQTFASMTLQVGCGEPDDSQNQACLVSYGYESEEIAISPEGDVDFHRFEGSRGDVVEIRAANTPGSSLDGEIYLLDEDGNCLALNDDEDETRTSSLLTAVLDRDGSYFVRYAHFTNDPASACPDLVVATRAMEALAPSVKGTEGNAAGGGDTTTGGYTLSIRTVEPPPIRDLRAFSGFDGLIPMSWSDPAVWILGSDPFRRVVERSTDGQNFQELGESPFASYLDLTATNATSLQYRVQAVYPYGVGSVLSKTVTANARAGGYEATSPFTQSPPTLDGSIDDAEWADAITVALTEETLDIENGDVFLKHDDRYLYVAVKRQAETAGFGIYFDGDRDGTWGSDEGVYLFLENSSKFFIPVSGQYPNAQHGNAIENPTGVDLSLTSRQFEVRIDLQTAKLSASPGDAIGFFVYAFTSASAFANYPDAPGGVLFQTPAAFASITLEEAVAEMHVTESLSFEDTVLGESETRPLTIENRGIRNLELTGFRLAGTGSAHFEVPTRLPITIAPNNSAEVSVVFSPQAHGDHVAALAIESNDPTPPPDVQLSGQSTNQAPNLQVTAPVVRVNENTPIAVVAIVTDDDALATVVAHYRTGDDTPVEIRLVATTENRYEGQVPAAAATEDGLAYRVTATDNEGLTTLSPDYLVRVQIAGLTGTTFFPADTQAGYRLVSLPTDLEDPYGAFTRSFGSYDRKKWRLFELDTSQSYVELSSPRTMSPGEGYWLLVRDGGTLGTGAGETVDLSGVRVPLNAGWTFIGNPYAFGLSLGQIATESGAPVDVRTYEGSWSIESGGLEPFRGYAVFSQNADQLKFEVTGTPFARNTPRRDLDHDWIVEIAAECQGARDDDNRMGVHREATSGRDSFDRPEPPTIGDYISLYFPRPHWQSRAERFSEDIRDRESKLSWQFEVQSNIDDTVALSVNLDNLPDSLSAWVIESGTAVVWDLRSEPVFTIDSAARRTRSFELLVGRQSDLDDALEGSGAVTSLDGGHLGFPNPFRRTTTIYYQTTRPQPVTVAIYGVNGNRVRVLRDHAFERAGRHSVVWDGRDEFADTVASGTYFYRIKTEDGSATRRLILLK